MRAKVVVFEGVTSMKRAIVLEALMLTAFVYGLFVWIYISLISLTHPEWLPMPFSHIDIRPFNWRADVVAMVAFAVSALGFFLWQVIRPKPGI